MKSGAIFDMDGLLFDTEVLYNDEWKKVAATYGYRVDQQMLDELRGTNGAVMYCIINKYWPEADAEKMVRELFENAKITLSRSVPVKKGVRELLTYLKDNKIRMAVASSSPLNLIVNNLKIAGIDSYFDVVVSGDQVTHGKPAPDIFLLAASRLGLKAEDCYVLEDGPNGVYAGVKAGCSTIMVPDLIKPTEELYKICEGVYKSLTDVMEAMKKGDC